MLTIYVLIKVVHVFAAIVAVGTNITYGVWIGRAKRDPASLPFALRGVKFLDDRVANPCYGLLVLTGFAMAGVSKLPLTTPWILAAIGLVLVVFGVARGLRAFLNQAIRGQLSKSLFTFARRSSVSPCPFP